MRELKIFGVVAFFSLFTYYLVEPYAHHAMHAKYDAQGNEIEIESHGFVYDGSTEAAATARAISDLEYKSEKIPEEITELKVEIKDKDANKTAIQTEIDTKEKVLAGIPKLLATAKDVQTKKQHFGKK